MIAYLPEIYPDELVYSWFCRYYVHSGFMTHKMALQQLYCKRSDDPSKEFVGNLNGNARTVIEAIHLPDTLILEHTMYPQYARFIPLEERKTALRRLWYDHCDPHHLFAILPRSGEERNLRFCPLCASEDRDRYGEAYWHRKHQIRGLAICPKHQCRLKAAPVLAKSEHSDVFYPAETSIHAADVEYVDDPLVIKFAAFVGRVFNAPVDIKLNFSICEVLRQGMKGTKYLSASGKIRYVQKLAGELQAYYQKMGLHSIASMSQTQRVLLGERYDFSVVCQIAFFLGMTTEELTDTVLLAGHGRREGKRDVSPVDWGRLDRETAPALEALAEAVYTGSGNNTCRPERVSERLAYRELRLSAHQLEKLPLCREIMARYDESYPELWARRIIWAYQKLEQEKQTPICWSDIRSLAGVKKKNLPDVIPYLRKYAGQRMTDQIMRLFTKGSSSGS